MSKKKPLSFAEKREKVLQIFHGNKEFYQLKDIEKIATSQKGVVEKSVKEVLISLVDDDLVDSAKIAQSTYYWSFPSNVKVQKKEKYLAMQTELKEVQIKLTNAEDNLEKLKVSIFISLSFLNSYFCYS